MSEIWKLVLSLSLSGTVMFLALLLFCRIFAGKLGRAWQYYIWLAVVARLLIPFYGERNLTGSVFAKLEQYAGRQSVFAQPYEEGDGSRTEEPGSVWEIRRAEAEEPGPDAAFGSGLPAGAVPGAGSSPGADTPQKTGRFLEYMGVLWLAVAVILLIRRIVACRDFIRHVRRESEPADPALLEQFGRIAEGLRIRNTVELRIFRPAASPMLAGCIRPMVILPSAELSEEEFRYTALHELSHYRRLDVCYKWLVQFAVCLHWFNPFVRLLGREVDRACELACDEAVIRNLTADEKRMYGDTLLHAAERCRPWKRRAGAVTLHESGKQLKGRLEAIIAYRERSKAGKAMSVLLAAGVLGSAAVLGAYAGPKAEESASGSKETADASEQEEEEARFVSGGFDFLLSDGSPVVERDGVVFILCDGLEEEKIPPAGVVDGTMIMAVHPGSEGSGGEASSVASVSVTLSADRSKIFREAEEVCRGMRQKGMLSENDAKRILEAAEELQKRETWMPRSDQFAGNYYQSAYYEAPYLFFVGYDLTEEAVQQYAGTKITLEDGEELHVSFADSARAWMEDERFLDVLSTQFSQFRRRTGSRVSGIRRPVISGVEAVGYDVEGLAAAYYEEDDMGRFSVMISELSEDRQEEYLEKAYQEEDAAVLSIVLWRLEEDGLEEEWIDSWLTRAYEDENVGFFCIFSDCLSEKSRQEWYERMKREQESLYAGILRESMDDTEKDDLWEDPENEWDADWF